MGYMGKPGEKTTPWRAAGLWHGTLDHIARLPMVWATMDCVAPCERGVSMAGLPPALPVEGDDERYMSMALEQAAMAAAANEVPIGAVVVHEGEVIARAHNRRELDENPSAHAEFSAMLEAARILGRWRLTGCTVYVTLEPCLMCAGLMVNGRIDRCVYGAPDPKGGALGSLYDVSHDERLNHEFAVTSGVLQEECAAQLQSFFRRRRQEARAARDAARAAAHGGNGPLS